MKNCYKTTKAACYTGYVIQAVVNNLLPLFYVIFNAAPYHISVTRLGKLSLLNFSMQLVIDFLSIYFVPRFGLKKCAVLAQGASCFGFLLLFALPFIINTYLAVIVSMVFLSVGSGMIEVVISPIIEALPEQNKSGNMSILHSFYSWGQMIVITLTTLLLLFFGKQKWQIIALIWCILPAVNTLLFSKSEILELNNQSPELKGLSIFKNKSIYPFLGIILCGGAAEIAMVQWSSFFVETEFLLQKWVCDLLGPCAFALFMGIGRIAFGFIGDRISLKKVLFGSALLCLFCYLTVAFSKSAALSLVATAVCGLSVSVMWPGAFSLAAAHYKGGSSAMFSFLAMAGDLGCGLGPFVLALATSCFSRYFKGGAHLLNFSGNNGAMQAGFFVAAIFPLCMILLLLFGFKNKAKS